MLFTSDIPSHRTRTGHRISWVSLAALLLLCVPFSGCATGAAAAPVRHAAPSPTTTTAPIAARSTATSTADCATLIQPPLYNMSPFPLPPNTISSYPNGASGGSTVYECTPNATQASITDYLNTALPQAGWQRWDPTTETAYCGIEANTFWLYSKGGAKGEAVGWSVAGSGGLEGPPLPMWMLAFCDLAFGN